MIANLDAWIKEAESDIHWNGGSKCGWQERFLAVVAELERANKIIDRML